MKHGRGDDTHRALSQLDPPLDIRATPTNRDALWGLLERAEPPVMFWSSPDEVSLIGAGEVVSIDSHGESAIEDQQQQAESIFEELDYAGPPTARPRLLGGMSFDQLPPTGSHWSEFPASYFFLPKSQITTDGDDTWYTAIGPAQELTSNSRKKVGHLPTVLDSCHEPNRTEWNEQVIRSRTEIRNDAYSKVVLAQALDLQLSDTVSLPPLVKTLQRENPNCFISAFKPTKSAVFVAATPERLVTRENTKLRTDALAGSSKRGDTDGTDKRLSNQLEASQKNRHEHALVVEAITDELDRFGGAITIGDRRVFRLQTVQHLHTPIEVQYDQAPHILEVVKALHPTPAVGGLPRDAANEAIQRIESIDRGWYAAPIGWHDANGNGSFAIGIRSGIFREKSARLFAGAGIVANSDPAEEWNELQLKYEPLLSCFTQK